MPTELGLRTDYSWLLLLNLKTLPLFSKTNRYLVKHCRNNIQSPYQLEIGRKSFIYRNELWTSTSHTYQRHSYKSQDVH